MQFLHFIFEEMQVQAVEVFKNIIGTFKNYSTWQAAELQHTHLYPGTPFSALRPGGGVATKGRGCLLRGLLLRGGGVIIEPQRSVKVNWDNLCKTLAQLLMYKYFVRARCCCCDDDALISIQWKQPFRPEVINWRLKAKPVLCVHFIMCFVCHLQCCFGFLSFFNWANI